LSVAYVNVVDGLTSFFWWREKVDKAREALLVVKTKLEKLPRLVEGVKELHSYVCQRSCRGLPGVDRRRSLLNLDCPVVSAKNKHFLYSTSPLDLVKLRARRGAFRTL